MKANEGFITNNSTLIAALTFTGLATLALAPLVGTEAILALGKTALASTAGILTACALFCSAIRLSFTISELPIFQKNNDAQICDFESNNKAKFNQGVAITNFCIVAGAILGTAAGISVGCQAMSLMR